MTSCLCCGSGQTCALCLDPCGEQQRLRVRGLLQNSGCACDESVWHPLSPRLGVVEAPELIVKSCGSLGAAWDVLW